MAASVVNLNNAVAQLTTTAVVKGMILLWSGAKTGIPTGWLLCDGTNGTPDLRDKFVVGATSTYAVGASGGSADAIVVSHKHTASTNKTGAHTHGYTSPWSSQILQGGTNPAVYTTNPQTTTSAGDHSHTVTVDNFGSAATNANLPPYYALCYIMKS